MKKLNIYLDIDDVILANKEHQAVKAAGFINHIVDTYNVYCLTTRSTDGDSTHAMKYVLRATNENIRPCLKKIIPTNWEELKTEAMDFSHPFLWFDDNLYDGEREILKQNNAINSFVKVDLNKKPLPMQDELEKVKLDKDNYN